MHEKASANRPRPGSQPHTQVAAESGLLQVTKIDKGSKLPRAIRIARGSLRSKASQEQRYSGQRRIMYIYQLVSHSLRELRASLVKQSDLSLQINRTIKTQVVINPLASPSLRTLQHIPLLDPFRVQVRQIRHIYRQRSSYLHLQSSQQQTTLLIYRCTDIRTNSLGLLIESREQRRKRL